MIGGVYVVGVGILVLVILVFIWAAWYYVIAPITKSSKRRGKKLNLWHYVILVLLAIALLGVGFLFFYMDGFWKIIPLAILVIFYLLRDNLFR